MGAGPFAAVISQRAAELLRGKTDLNLLEAGCGSASYFTFPEVTRSVGIDIDPSQLERNTVLHEKILGDLQIYPLPEGKFDIVVCWDVIEHLSAPKRAFQNMAAALKPGGLLILGCPHLLSFKGILTKFTPFWFHEFVYRRMHYSSRHFPTYLRLDILPDRLRHQAAECGLLVAYSAMIEGGLTKKLRREFAILNAAFLAIDFIWRAVTFRKRESLFMDNCAFVFQKQPVCSAVCG